MSDRFNQEPYERVTDADLIRISTISEKGVWRDLLGALLSGVPEDYAFSSATFPTGVIAGCVTIRQDANNVRVNPGSWVAWDTTVTDAFANPVIHGRLEAQTSNINIPNAAGGQARWDRISVPITAALTESNADSESRNFKNALSNTFTTSATPKRITQAIAGAGVLRTAGNSVASGGGSDNANGSCNDIPAGYMTVSVVRATSTGIAVGEVFDARRMVGFKPQFKAQDWIQSFAVGPAGLTQKNEISGIAIPKVGFRFNGNGASNPTMRDSFGVKPVSGITVTRAASGAYDFDTYRAFASNTKIMSSYMFIGTSHAKVAIFQPGGGAAGVHRVQIGKYQYDGTSGGVADVSFAATDLIAGEELCLYLRGEQT